MSVSKNKVANSYYFIGIKGVGMTMLAQFLAQSGFLISGSDIVDSFLTDEVLAKAKIPVFSPFSPKNISLSAQTIVYSSAFDPKNNVELAFIKKNPDLFAGARIISYAEALGEIFSNHFGLAVVGSHGKTTVSAWLGFLLTKAGRSPSVLVGSSVPQLKGQSAMLGKSRYFVAEVDEYQNKLRYFQPQGVILNNIEFDHPDFFKNKQAYTKVFADFIKKIPESGFLVANLDDRAVAKISVLNRGRLLGYQLSEAKEISAKNGITSFVFSGRKFKIRLLGRHNIANALAVIKSARALNVSWLVIQKYLGLFSGTTRRSQVMGKYKGALIIDDYAHHPTEIKATLSALRSVYKKNRLITVFHPHTYTRTKALFADFASSFADTDELIVLDIYGSAREKKGGVSSGQLVKAIKERNKKTNTVQSVENIKDMLSVSRYLRRHLKKNDILVLMGAGDVFRVGEDLLGLSKLS